MSHSQGPWAHKPRKKIRGPGLRWDRAFTLLAAFLLIAVIVGVAA